MKFVVSFLVSFGAAVAACCAAEPVTMVNSLGMKLVAIEAGEFWMGSPESEEGRGEDELRHRVKLSKAFHMGQHEVTVGQFRKFVEATRYRTALEREGKPGFGYDTENRVMEQLARFDWRQVGFEQTENHPVVNLSWDDCHEFCEWLSKQEGRRYRLPTEAQWEYCCRAGTTTRYSTGEAEESLTKGANVADASFLAKYADATRSVEWNDKHPFTAPVGNFEPNRWGLHDMHGNVWEWCADWYGRDYYKGSPAADPEGPPTGEIHVLRSGAFTNRGRLLRSADRDAARPKYRGNFAGFRVVLLP